MGSLSSLFLGSKMWGIGWEWIQWEGRLTWLKFRSVWGREWSGEEEGGKYVGKGD
jgi:hypothetical protein